MAKGAKKKASNIVVWIILILLMVGLAGFGATNFGGSVRSIGSVGDTEIEVNRYARELQQELRSLQAQTGQNITLAQAQAFGIDRAVLQRLIGAAALEQETGRLGISVGDAEVQRQVLSSPAFQGIDGSFDRDAYETTLDRSGLSPSAFENSLRKDVARNILQSAVTSGVAAPSVFTDTLIAYVGERRNFSWIRLDDAALSDPLPEPSDQELQAFYAENTDRFMIPESRDITYAWLSPDRFVDQVEVDDDALRALYDDRAEEYDQPERRLVEQLVYGTEDEARAARAAIDDGSKTFEELVNERGLTLPDVDLGDVSRDDIGPAADAVFGLDGPGIVGPVTTSLGPALMRVNAILPAQQTPFEDAREELKAEFTMDRARRMIGDRIDTIDDLLAGGATLEDLAGETDMNLGQVLWTPDMSDGLTAYEEFKTVAAEVTTEDFPEVHQLADGGLFALRLNEVIPAHPEAYEDAKQDVIAAWEAAETRKRLLDRAAEMKAQIENGASLGSFDQGVTVETHLTRDAFIEETSPAFMERIFAMEPGTTAVIDDEKGVFIAQVSDVLPAETQDPDTRDLARSLSEAMRQGIANDMLDAFTDSMVTEAGISLNQTAINAVHSQFP